MPFRLSTDRVGGKGLDKHNPAKSGGYSTDDIVINNNRLYAANANIPVNTAFTIGTTGATWRIVSFDLLAHDSTRGYRVGDAVFRGNSIMIAKSSIGPKAFLYADWTISGMRYVETTHTNFGITTGNIPTGPQFFTFAQTSQAFNTIIDYTTGVGAGAIKRRWLISDTGTAVELFIPGEHKPDTRSLLVQEIPGIYGHWSAKDPLGTGVEPANGTQITTWVDLTKQGRNFVAWDAASAPTYESVTKTLASDGSKRLNLNASASPLAEFTMFIAVESWGVPSTWSRMLSVIASGQTKDYDNTASMALLIQDALGNNTIVSSQNLVTQPATPYTGGKMVYAIRVAAGANADVFRYVDGELVSSFIYTAARLIDYVMVLGDETRTQKTTVNTPARINELVIYNRALTNAEISTINGIMMHGLDRQDQLSSLHTYKTNRPEVPIGQTIVSETEPSINLTIPWNNSTDGKLYLVSKTGTVSKWRELSAPGGIALFDIAKSGGYALNDIVVSGTKIYMANALMAMGVAFAIGTTGQTWREISASTSPNRSILLQEIPDIYGYWSGTDPLGTGVAPANNAQIPTWADLTGQGRDFVAWSGTTAPTYDEATKTLASDGSKRLNLDTTAKKLTQFTMFLAIENWDIPGSVSWHRMLSVLSTGDTADNNSSTSMALILQEGGGNPAFTAFQNGALFGTVPYTGGKTVVAIRVDTLAAANMLRYINGDLTSSHTFVGARNIDRIMLMGDTQRNENAGTFLPSKINDLVIYDRALTNSEISSVTGILMHNLNRQDQLPTVHTFKSVRPEVPIGQTIVSQTKPPLASIVHWNNPTDGKLYSVSKTGSVASWVEVSPTVAAPTLAYLKRDYLMAEIPGLWGLYDGRDPNGNGVEPANGAVLSSVQDLSGNGHHMSTWNAASSPLYNATNKSFGGEGDGLRRLFLTNINPTLGAVTVLMAVDIFDNTGTGSGDSRIASFISVGNTDDYRNTSNSSLAMFLHSSGSPNSIRTYHNNLPWDWFDHTAGPVILAVTVDASTVKRWKNGIKSGTDFGFVGTPNIDRFMFLGDETRTQNAARVTKTNIRQLAIFDRVLTDDEMNQAYGIMHRDVNQLGILENANPYKAETFKVPAVQPIGTRLAPKITTAHNQLVWNRIPDGSLFRVSWDGTTSKWVNVNGSKDLIMRGTTIIQDNNTLVLKFPHSFANNTFQFIATPNGTFTTSSSTIPEILIIGNKTVNSIEVDKHTNISAALVFDWIAIGTAKN